MDKFVKRGLILLFVLCFGIGGALSQPMNAEAKKASIKLNKKVCTLQKGQSVKLKAKVSSKKLKKKIKWKTNKKAVATVSKKGKVTAKGAGTAVITASVKGTKLKAKCKVVVSAAAQTPSTETPSTQQPAANTPSSSGGNNQTSSGGDTPSTQPTRSEQVTVNTADELTAALADSSVAQITIGESASTLSIPEGTYEDVDLYVNAPNGHIENYAVFKSITIAAISESSFVEHATGNTIYYLAASGKVEIAESAVASLTVSAAGKLSLVVNGSLSALNVDAEAQITISGDATGTISLTASSGAEGADITTNQNLNITADAKLDLTLQSGAEETIAEVSTGTQIPTVSGLGSVPVTITDVNDLEVVVGTNTGEGTNGKKVVVSGIVRTTEGTGLGDASVSFIPYVSGVTTENIANYLSGSGVINVTTAVTGAYTTDSIDIGNYYLYVTKEGYFPVLETVVITSATTDTYNMEAVEMISSENTDPGSLSGTLTDAQSGDPVGEGLTVRIRSGKNNLSGDVLATTTTDANGAYSFTGLTPGQYTVQVLDTRDSETLGGNYVTTSFTAVVESGENVKNETVTFQIESGQVRFVLTWGDEASGASSDLDSHLTGPAASGEGQFHTWYSDQVYSSDNLTYADLDVDDVTWEGPETTTIYQACEGVYHFYIHDYTNRSNPSSSQMSQSSAVVKVYVGERLKATYNMPNQAGNLWYVCDYDVQSGTLTPVNTVSGWSADLEDIGIDVYAKYQGLLKDYLGRVTEIKDQITDSDTLSEVEEMLKTAQDVYDDSESTQEEIIEQYGILKKWLSSVTEGLEIYSVSGTGISDYSYSSDDVLDGTAVLTVYSYSSTFPDDFTVSLPTGSSYELKASDSSDYDKMIVVTSATGLTCTYYISYVVDEDYGCAITSVTAGDDVSITGWYTSAQYDDDDDFLGYYVLYATAAVKDIPESFAVTAKNTAATVAYETSDKDGYAKKITVTSGSASRTYYVKWTYQDPDFAIQSVTQTVDGESAVSYWSASRSSSGSTGTLYVSSYALLDSGTITITAAGSDVTAEIQDVEDSDDDDDERYTKMVVLTKGTETYTYYLSWSLMSGSIYVDSVSAEDADGNELVSDWDNDYDDDDNNVIYVTGSQTTIPDSLSVTGYLYVNGSRKTVAARLETADKDGYNKKVTLSYLDSSRVYYLKWTYRNPDFKITDVSHQVDGKTALYSWSQSTESEYSILYVSSYAAFDKGTFTVTPKGSDVTVTMEDSDKSAYNKKIVLTEGEDSYTYYLSFKVTGSFWIQSVTATDADGFSVISSYGTSWSSDDYRTLNVVASVETVPDDLTVKAEAYLDDDDVTVTATVTDSDKTGYAKKVVASYLDYSLTYYVNWTYRNPDFEIGELTYTSDEENALYSYSTNVTSANEGRLYLYGYLAKDTGDLTVLPVGEGVTVTMETGDYTYGGMKCTRKAVLTKDEESFTYYISYSKVSTSTYLSSVKATDADGNSLISSWNTEWKWEYSSTDSSYGILTIYGTQSTVPDTMKARTSIYFSGESIKLKGTIEDSDKEDYEKMVVFTYLDSTWKYYIEWKYEDPDFDIGSVTHTVSEENMLYSWSTNRSVSDTFGILNISSYADLAKGTLTITPETSGVTAEIKDADYTYNGTTYTKQVVLTKTDETSYTYYIRATLASSIYLDKVTATDSEGTGILSSYSTGWDEDADENEFRTLTLYGTQEDAPSAITITGKAYLGDETAALTATLEDSDKDGYLKKATLAYGDASLVYYVKWVYEESSDTDYGISSVSCTVNETDADGNVTETNVLYDWETDTYTNYGVLTVNAYASVDKATLTITSDDEDNITVGDLEASDKDDYEKKVVFTDTDGGSYTWYIDYNVTGYHYISSVTATDDDDNSVVSDYEIYYEEDEDGNEYRTLEVTATQETIPDNFAVAARVSLSSGYESATVTIETTDKTGYDRKITISYQDYSEVYYLKWSYEDPDFDISSVGFTVDGTDALYSYSTSRYADYGYIYLRTYASIYKGTLTVTAGGEDVTVKIRSSSNSSYKKMAVLTKGDEKYVYYISSSKSGSFTPASVTATDESGESVVSSYTTTSVYDSDSYSYINVIKVTATQETIPENLAITATAYLRTADTSVNATVKIKDSDEEDYDKKVVISYMDYKKVYYLDWEYTEETTDTDDTDTASLTDEPEQVDESAAAPDDSTASENAAKNETADPAPAANSTTESPAVDTAESEPTVENTTEAPAADSTTEAPAADTTESDASADAPAADASTEAPSADTSAEETAE